MCWRARWRNVFTSVRNGVSFTAAPWSMFTCGKLKDSDRNYIEHESCPIVTARRVPLRRHKTLRLCSNFDKAAQECRFGPGRMSHQQRLDSEVLTSRGLPTRRVRSESVAPSYGRSPRL